MHDTRAQNLQPVFSLPEFDLASRSIALNIDLRRWLSEREMRRTESTLDVLHLEECAAELLDAPLEMTHMGLLVDHQRFNLMKLWRVRLVAVAAIDAARRDNSDRRLLREHGAH